MPGVCLSVCGRSPCLLETLRKKNDKTDLPENFTTDVSVDKEALIKFWKSSGSELWMRTPDPYQIFLGGGMWSLTALVNDCVMRSCSYCSAEEMFCIVVQRNSVPVIMAISLWTVRIRASTVAASFVSA